MKHILIVSAYFMPDITPRSFRTTELVKELIREGYYVTLYIPFREYDYSDFKKEHNIKIKFLTKKKIGIELPKGNSILKRIYRYLFYRLNHYFEYPQIKLFYKIPKVLYGEKNYDLMISVAAPHVIHWGCSLAIRQNVSLCKKWIADCGDPFMGDAVSKKPIYFKFFEKRFCSRVDFITVPIKDAINAYYKEYRHKIRIIPQGFDFNQIQKTDSYIKNECPTFAYAGIFYRGYRDPTSFFEYLIDLKLNFKFYLFTKPSVVIDKYKAKLGSKLIVNDFIEREKLIPILAKMDFLVNFENMKSTQIPSKLIDYALTNRPILPIGNPINKEIVDAFMRGSYNKQTIIDNISQYNIVNVVKQFIEL